MDEFLFISDELVEELLMESIVSTLSLRCSSFAKALGFAVTLLLLLYSLVVDEDEDELELDDEELSSVWSEADRRATKELASLAPFKLPCWVL